MGQAPSFQGKNRGNLLFFEHSPLPRFQISQSKGSLPDPFQSQYPNARLLAHAADLAVSALVDDKPQQHAVPVPGHQLDLSWRKRPPIQGHGALEYLQRPLVTAVHPDQIFLLHL